MFDFDVFKKNKNYVLSGGSDGIVRVWSRVNRQLIT